VIPEKDKCSLSPEFARFEKLRNTADGMLPAIVYQRLYEYACDVPLACDVIEIGAGSGAGTVALAWGLLERAGDARVIAVDRCFGGSRLRFGGFHENLTRLRATLNEHGVTDRVRLLPIELNECSYTQVLGKIARRRVGLVVLDADGRLDRDLLRLWPYLSDGSHIVVDDCIERAAYRPVSAAYPVGGAKFTLTARIVNYLIKEGLLEIVEAIGKTFFLRVMGAGYSLPKEIVSNIMSIRDSVRLEWLAAVHPDLSRGTMKNHRSDDSNLWNHTGGLKP
jgi:hypothetical protein